MENTYNRNVNIAVNQLQTIECEIDNVLVGLRAESDRLGDSAGMRDVFERVCEITGLDASTASARMALESLEPRVAPVGHRWPRYENGDPVLEGDVVMGCCLTTSGEVSSVAINSGGWALLDEDDDIIMSGFAGEHPRMAMKDCDGEVLHLDDEVWLQHEAEEDCGAHDGVFRDTQLTVEELLDDDYAPIKVSYYGGGAKEIAYLQPHELTHRKTFVERKVLDKDGGEVRKGALYFIDATDRELGRAGIHGDTSHLWEVLDVCAGSEEDPLSVRVESVQEKMNHWWVRPEWLTRAKSARAEKATRKVRQKDAQGRVIRRGDDYLIDASVVELIVAGYSDRDLSGVWVVIDSPSEDDGSLVTVAQSGETLKVRPSWLTDRKK